MPSLQDQVFILTGGAGAIAGAVAEAFARAGARLVLVDKAQPPLQARAQALEALPLTHDLTQYPEAVRMVEAAKATFGRVDGLIHTVGGFATGRLHEAPPEAYDQLFDANVRSLFYAVRAVLPELKASGSGFIAGFAAGPAWRGGAAGMGLYAAAKSAVAALLRSLDAELTEGAIRVAVLYPMGAVDTPQNRRAMPHTDPQTWIAPEAIAEALLFAATRGPRGRLLEIPIYPPR